MFLTLPTRGPQKLAVLRVVDGDTVLCAYLMPVKCRLSGTKSPELREPGGPEAKLALASMIPLTLHLADVELHGREKYERVLTQFGDVNERMVASGHATRYYTQAMPEEDLLL